VLAVIGKVFFIGEKPGMGQTMKLANNMLSATAMVASSEVMVMGVKAGLDPNVMIEVIKAGSVQPADDPPVYRLAGYAEQGADQHPFRGHPRGGGQGGS